MGIGSGEVDPSARTRSHRVFHVCLDSLVIILRLESFVNRTKDVCFHLKQETSDISTYHNTKTSTSYISQYSLAHVPLISIRVCRSMLVTGQQYEKLLSRQNCTGSKSA